MKRKQVKNIILFLFVILLFVIALLIVLILNSTNTKSEEIQENVNVIVQKEPTTIKEVIEKYDSIYVFKDKNDLFVTFAKDLYDDNGNSNQEYFYSIIEDLKPFFVEDFRMIDNENGITLNINLQTKKIIINEIEDFYSKIDGKDYINVEKVEIAPVTFMPVRSDELYNIFSERMFIDEKIIELLGEEDVIEGESNYKSYQNGKIKVNTCEFVDRIKHIIFSKDYEGEIFDDVKVSDSLEKILERYPEKAFGSIKEGYLGYRTEDVYIFFYEDEASIYGYSYDNNTKIENYIENYFNDKDLSMFYTSMISSYDIFNEYSYDAENKNLYMTYPALGMKIDIKNNSTEGITLYNNFYLGDRTKQWIKDGLIKLEEDVDYIEQIEKERVRNKKGE